jgi:hypothetical protein
MRQAAATMIECLTAPIASLCPRRIFSRRYYVERPESLERVLAWAASVSAIDSHFDPLRVLPERRLPADSSLPGHRAGARSRAKRRMNAPPGHLLGHDELPDPVLGAPLVRVMFKRT